MSIALAAALLPLGLAADLGPPSGDTWPALACQVFLGAMTAATPAQLLLVLPCVGAFVLLAAASWRRMQLDR
ncbi:hypothetical protein ACPW96_15060 [Micromonospora sp. DT81.3]|uniref:hypothetical protein n=1 Tax=Micromonospora sp. DT81.3 TaxID=3416523 RepID=UPI003CEB01BD